MLLVNPCVHSVCRDETRGCLCAVTAWWEHGLKDDDCFCTGASGRHAVCRGCFNVPMHSVAIKLVFLGVFVPHGCTVM